MVAIEIQATGQTFDDLSFAIEEIVTRLHDGFTSGMDSNESGSYTFQIVGREDETMAES